MGMDLFLLVVFGWGKILVGNNAHLLPMTDCCKNNHRLNKIFMHILQKDHWCKQTEDIFLFLKNEPFIRLENQKHFTKLFRKLYHPTKAPTVDTFSWHFEP